MCKNIKILCNFYSKCKQIFAQFSTENATQDVIEYLGHKITPSRIFPLCRHVDILLLQPHPPDVHGLQRFLGMVNFY